jgi:hypothetical protein
MKTITKLPAKVKSILKSSNLKSFSSLKVRCNSRFGKANKNFLHLTSKYSKVSLVKYCHLTLNLSLLSKTLSGNTALHYACRLGKLSLVRYLVKSATALLDMPNKKKQSPLLLAAKFNHEAVCIFLINSGADFNLQDKRGCAVGHFAAAHAMINLLKLLYTKSYRFSLENNNKESIIHYAAWSGDIDCFEFAHKFLSLNTETVKGNFLLYCKGNWQLLQWVIQCNYLKLQHNEKKTLISIGTPLEIFERNNIVFKVTDALEYDREDLIELMYRRRELNVKGFCFIIANYALLKEKCERKMKNIWEWSQVCAFLFAYKFSNKEIFRLPAGIIRELTGFLKAQFKHPRLI